MSSALSAWPDLWHTAAMTMSTTQRGVMGRFLAGAMPLALAVGCAQVAACPSPPAPTSAPTSTPSPPDLAAPSSSPSSSPSPSPSSPRDPVPPAPTPSLAPAPVPSPPWTVRVFDGSGNVWRLWRDSGALPAAFAYEPMSPERSSQRHLQRRRGPQRSADVDAGDPAVAARPAPARRHRPPHRRAAHGHPGPRGHHRHRRARHHAGRRQQRRRRRPRVLRLPGSRGGLTDLVSCGAAASVRRCVDDGAGRTLHHLN